MYSQKMTLTCSRPVNEIYYKEQDTKNYRGAQRRDFFFNGGNFGSKFERRDLALHASFGFDGDGSVYSASTVGINLIKPIERGK